VSLRLRPKARLVRRGRTGKMLLVYPERALELNASAVEVVELLDGTRTLADIVSEIAARHPDAAPDAIFSGVQRFVSQLAARALVDT